MSDLAGLLHEGSPACPFCGDDSCSGFPNTQPIDTATFYRGQESMAQEPHIIATDRIVDDALGRVVYGPGDAVPLADAEKYGLVAADKPKAKKKAADAPAKARAKKGPTEDRMKRKGEDRDGDS